MWGFSNPTNHLIPKAGPSFLRLRKRICSTTTMVLAAILKTASTLLFLLVLAFAVFVGWLQRWVVAKACLGSCASVCACLCAMHRLAERIDIQPPTPRPAHTTGTPRSGTAGSRACARTW